jgi:putative DNA methylase
MQNRKKLIEVALPLEAINKASVRESYIYRGNPSAIHKWWAQRPLAAARAVIFAQMVDDPSANRDLFLTLKAQEKERQRLFKIIEQLVQWESTTNEEILQKARTEIWQSWRRACADNVDHPRAKELFNRNKLPAFCDPFAGAGTLPLEAQRLGLESHASDLNPVAVLIGKATIEIPARFVGRPPVNPCARAEKTLAARQWNGTEGLADDVRYYGQWMREEAEKRIGHLYPKVEITAPMVKDRPDLKPLLGKKVRVLAWLWARTVKSPNPAFGDVDVPLASTFMLSTRSGKEAFVEPLVQNDTYQFRVSIGRPKQSEAALNGTSAGKRKAFFCLLSRVPIAYEYIRNEAKGGRLGARLMAAVVQGERGRVYLSPTDAMEAIAKKAKATWAPDCEMPAKHRNFQPPVYGMNTLGQIFTQRQLLALDTFSDLVHDAMAIVKTDAVDAGLDDDRKPLGQGGDGATAYAEAIGVYLAMAEDKAAEYGCTIVPWYTKEDRPKGLFARQAIPMVWDYAEVNPFADIGGTLIASIDIVAGALSGCAPRGPVAVVNQLDAVRANLTDGAVISTDPPYYDNISYADLSDFFYVWLRRSLREIFPDLFSTVAVPKAEELIASPARHGSKEQAEEFFLAGMTEAMRRLVEYGHPTFPITIYYAFKQTENDQEEGVASTGWDTFLDAVIRAGFGITGTWPIRTERGSRSTGIGSNALASSIVLVCRPRPVTATTATRREFVTALKTELPTALSHLQRSNIAPVDLAQAAIGPGMAVYTRYSKVLDAEGKPLSVRQALALINQSLDETLAEQEGDFDADSRWALAWFEQSGFSEGEYGLAETLSKAKNTSVSGMVEARIVASKGGKVRLLKPKEMPAAWDPTTDQRLTAWEMVHQLIRSLEASGEGAAAALVAKLGSKAEIARELAYRLYSLCERKKRAAEALSYNALVQSWPEISRLSREDSRPQPAQAQLI